MSNKKKDKENKKKETKPDPKESANAAPEEKPADTPEEEPKKEEKTEGDGKPMVPLKVFCKLSGKKPDQMAGFNRYALNNKMGPMTVPKWQEELKKFQSKPMR